jgi:hypothetical protein
MFFFSPSFLEAVSRELELMERRRQVLDRMLRVGKISQVAYDTLCGVVDSSVRKIKVFADEAISEVNRLEKRGRMLEVWLWEAEFQRAAGEIGEESYQHLSDAINLAVRTARRGAQRIQEMLRTLNLAPTPPSTLEAKAQETGQRTVGEGFEEAPESREPRIWTVPNGGKPAEVDPEPAGGVKLEGRDGRQPF